MYVLRWSVGEKFVRTTGYNDVAELNNIIIIYPQAINSTGNLGGCWDVWGYNDNANFYSEYYIWIIQWLQFS